MSETVYTLHVQAPGEFVPFTAVTSTSLPALQMIRDALNITGVNIIAETTTHALRVIAECGTCQGCRNAEGCYREN